MKISKLHKKESGAAVIEVAVIMPLLLMLTFGAIKYGWLFYRLQQITNVTRNAARVAIRAGDHSAEALAVVTNRMAEYRITDFDVQVPNGWNPSPGQQMILRIVVPTNQVDLFPTSQESMIHLPAPATLAARIALSKEGAFIPGS